MKIKKLNESMLPSQATLDDCLDDYRQNAFGFDGVEDYVDTNYPMHPQEFKAAVCDYLKGYKNESLEEAWQIDDEVVIKWTEPGFEPYAYATCEYKGKTEDGKHKFKSITYGWDFIVDLENKKIKTPHNKEYDLWDESGWTKNATNESTSIKQDASKTISGTLYKVMVNGKDEFLLTEEFDEIVSYLDNEASTLKDFNAIIYTLSDFIFNTTPYLEYDGIMHQNLIFPDIDSKSVIYKNGVCKTILSAEEFKTPSKSNIENYIIRLTNNIQSIGNGVIVSPAKEQFKSAVKVDKVLHLFNTKQEALDYVEESPRWRKIVSLNESKSINEDVEINKDYVLRTPSKDFDVYEPTFDVSELKVGTQIRHQDFENPVTITNIFTNPNYNTYRGIGGIEVTDGSNKYHLWFDNETLRHKGYVGGNLKKISLIESKSIKDRAINESTQSYDIMLEEDDCEIDLRTGELKVSTDVFDDFVQDSIIRIKFVEEPDVTYEYKMISVDDEYITMEQLDRYNDELSSDLYNESKSINEEWNKEWDNIGIEIEKAAREQHIGVDFIKTDNSVMGAFTATFQIDRGDWKHDHWAFDEVVKECLANNEKYALWKIDTNQIGSPEDDSYSAEHIAFIVPKDKMELLNSMKGLFAESVNPADLTNCPECGDTSFDSKRGKCTKCNYIEELDESKCINESSYKKGDRVELANGMIGTVTKDFDWENEDQVAVEIDGTGEMRYPRSEVLKDLRESSDDLKGYNIIKKGNMFRITDDNDVELDIDFESEDSAKEYINTIDEKDLRESASTMIYLFPELTDEDIEMAKGYGLQFLGKNHGADGSEDNWVMKGQESSLRMFADNYLGYELHPSYLYDEEDFAGEIINESLVGLELDKDDILDWLAEHEQAWADAERYFGDSPMEFAMTSDADSPLEEVSVKDLVEWIADHNQLYDDFYRFFYEDNLDEGFLNFDFNQNSDDDNIDGIIQ